MTAGISIGERLADDAPKVGAHEGMRARPKAKEKSRATGSGAT
jgi:hypothetical protein